MGAAAIVSKCDYARVWASKQDGVMNSAAIARAHTPTHPYTLPRSPAYLLLRSLGVQNSPARVKGWAVRPAIMKPTTQAGSSAARAPVMAAAEPSMEMDCGCVWVCGGGGGGGGYIHD